ncbi:hypothetical protein M441DRAFT_61443 [Trichoderma asperellum CBS 433.97]|uniref:Uncharacterized protein n=1 Tax=Trichoderma asperellum (strain ATCC 204424 / CBS 433.97 / NBRC 101777) TaxID=1042311 RepID=A0A2T3YVW8_TRIA4|nr:hypothetical protein M441DRAFT_61443 [Trichoderma asperellum CBS 433.97]PTB36709.1 hypothetical protein M441DRAFT_61443 [Trichoderma asperellum CBS 433.97]
MWRCRAPSNKEPGSLLLGNSTIRDYLYFGVIMGCGKVVGTSAASLATYVLAYVPPL